MLGIGRWITRNALVVCGELRVEVCASEKELPPRATEEGLEDARRRRNQIVAMACDESG